MTTWLKSESVRVNSGEEQPFVTDLVVGGAAGNYVRVASALEVEQRDEIERLRAALEEATEGKVPVMGMAGPTAHEYLIDVLRRVKTEDRDGKLYAVTPIDDWGNLVLSYRIAYGIPWDAVDEVGATGHSLRKEDA